ncbi:TetR/AcrR family transcriptional regulator [Virgibacillus alimentarius]|uniref:AcrR family transcriptional regulator n=1 Tax=Virgibacillus alimentarius TaxID=698769 RepID=A0ABS4SAT2_9BACI|nr:MULTISPECIES: TetR/AcrR family transcriptional regulator [Virgibacillus]MBP2258612.1 AcrR family transcriptional regulator [Virgibacillus alimentarius]HLR66691.1 TetR/AcrR family transcriptional regulator [Virgibacillus sp.]
MKLSEKKSLKKKEQILLSAVKIVNRHGYDGATMEEIAAELLMTKGSLYYYFKNKGDLMYQCHNLILSKAIDELKEHINEEDSAEEMLRNMIITHIDFAIEEQETFNLITRPYHTFNKEQLQEVLKLRKNYSGLFDQVIEKGLSSKAFKIKEPIIARMFMLGSMNWIQQWYNPDGRLSKKELQKIFGDYMIKLLK